MGAAASAPQSHLRDALDNDASDDDDGRLGISKSVLIAIFLSSFLLGASNITARVMAVFQVRTWFHHSSEAVIGPLTGVLLSSFSAARIAAPPVWRAAADATRSPKWLIVTTTLAGSIASAWFMVETSFWRALVARALAGALTVHCLLVRCIVRSCAPSAGDEAAGMAARTLGLGSSIVLVPPILGVLSAPCERMTVFARTSACAHPGGWLAHRQFTLIAIFVLALGVGATLAAALILPNPRVGSASGDGERRGPPVDLMFRPNLRRAAGPAKLAAVAAAAVAADAERGGASPQACSGACDLPRADSLPQPSPRAVARPLSSVFESVAKAGDPPSSNLHRTFSTALPARASALRRSTSAALQRAGSGMRHRAAALETRLADAVMYVGTRGFGAADAAVANLDAAAGAAVAQARADGEGSERAAAADRVPTSSTTMAPWWTSRHAVAAVAMYAAHTALHDGAFDLVSLTATARAPRDDVPGIRFAALAWIISIGGFASITASVCFYPLIARRKGPAAAVHAGLSVGLAGSALLAGAAAMAGPVAAVRVLQGAAQGSYGVSGGLASSGAQIVVNLAAPSRAIGAVNRAGNLASNVARVVAPIMAGGLWAIVAAPAGWAGWLPATLLAGLYAATLVASLLSDTRDKRAKVVY